MERGVQNGTRGGFPETKQRGGGCSQKRNSREPEVKHGVQRCIDVLLEHKHSSRSVQDKDNPSHHLHLIPFRVFLRLETYSMPHAAKAKDTTVYAKEMRNLMEKVRSTGAIMIMWTLRLIIRKNGRYYVYLSIVGPRNNGLPPYVTDIVCVIPNTLI